MNTNMKFAVTGQRIELTEPIMLVAGTTNIYTASFAFDAAWDGYTKTAVFEGYGVEREQLLTDDACTVPWEVLIAGKYLRVGVYGTKDDIRLPTIWTERTQYINSGAGPTEEAAEPSPTLVEQLTSKVGNLDALKTEDKSSLVAAINEVWASGGGGSGASVTDAAINEDGHLIITLSTGKQIDAGYAVGPAGADGKDGVDGQNGSDGKSAYQYAQEGGYIGTEADFTAKMAAEIPAVDDTLTQSGHAADAKATGDALRSLSEEMLTEESDPTVPAWAKATQKPSYTASEVGADPSGTAAAQVAAHNTGTDTHGDIRLLIQDLTGRLNALSDSDDTTLDQLSEIVAYIKSNRDLISSITTDKVSVSDIVDNLTTNVANKPLSAAQGVALKALIDAISVPDKLPNPNALTFTGAVTGSYDGSAPLSVEIPSGGGSSGGSTAEWQLLGTYTMLVSDRALTIDLSQFNGITHFRILGKFPKCSNDCGDTCIYLGTNFNHTQQTLNAQNVYAFNLLAECELVDGQLYGLIGTIDGWNRRPVASVAMNSPRDSGKNTNFKIYYTKAVEDSTANTIQIWGY